ncbi:sensor histidine kinase [Saccharopolyspora rosea]|uniref:histidine kinase n=1 Tax=Saccharopolyspora rosea TaxID=524884 RepID=A0ABW3FPB5_9PSEU|nr:sensor histidine kinase [Saccharopolyspora rosea]
MDGWISRFRARTPPWGADLAVTVVFGALSVWSRVLNWPSGTVSEWAGLAVSVVSSLTLLWRRRFPAAVTVVNAVARYTGPGPMGLFAALYALGAYERNRWFVWGVPTALVLVEPFAQGWYHHGAPDLQAYISVAVMHFLPVIIGLYVASRRALLAGWVDRAERAEREQALIAERTRSEERTRIAREMHDSVAHQVSLVVLHAGALEMLVEKNPAKATQAAATIQRVSRGALDELRQMIGVLRSGPDEDTAPQPTLRQVDELVAGSREAGLDVDLRVEGDRRDLPDHIERAAFRVVQEALTNVHKHAGGARASVSLTYRPERLLVAVRNSRPADGFRRHLPSGGQGLIGLGERVQLAGGTLDAGALDDGGFRVTAELPTGGEVPTGAEG